MEDGEGTPNFLRSVALAVLDSLVAVDCRPYPGWKNGLFILVKADGMYHRRQFLLLLLCIEICPSSLCAVLVALKVALLPAFKLLRETMRMYSEQMLREAARRKVS